MASRYLQSSSGLRLIPKIERAPRPYSATFHKWKYQDDIAKTTRRIRNEVTSKHCNNCGELRTLASFPSHREMCSVCCEKIWRIHQSLSPSSYNILKRPSGIPDPWGWLAWWKRMEYAGRKCEDCGAIKRLHMHHLTYSTFGREHFDHVRILCQRCHIRTHVRLRREAREGVAIAKDVLNLPGSEWCSGDMFQARTRVI
jgi:hypothetical protein